VRRLIPFIVLACAAHSASALDLTDAYRSALRHDAEFGAQQSAAEAGREYFAQSRAAVRPRVSLSGQVARLNTEVQTSFGEASNLIGSDARGNVYSYGVSLTQPLYRADAMADRRSLNARGQIADLTFSAARQDLILRVASAYFGVLLAQDTLTLARSQKAAVAEQLASARARFEAGRARVTDVAEAQAQFDALRATEIAAESDLVVTRARFAALTGREGEDPDPIDVKPRGTREGIQAWLDRADVDSIDNRIRNLEVAIAETDVARTRLAGRVSLDLVAQYEDQRQHGDLSPFAYPDETRGFSVGLQVSVPLYAGGALQSQYRQAVAKRNQARRQLEATRRDVGVSVREAYLDVSAGAQQVAALEQGLVSAQTSLDAGVLGREVGNRTNLDVLNLQQQVFDVKRDLADARYGYLLARLRLAALAGALSESNLTGVVTP
jgi:outer membrane protein